MNKLLYHFAFFLLIIGMVFTDLPFFPNYTVTHSLMFMIAPITFFILLLVKKFKIPISSNLKTFMMYGILTFVTSIILLVIAVLSRGGDFYAYGKNLFSKLFEAFFSLYILHFITYFLLLNIFLKLGIKAIKTYLIILFTLFILTGFVEFMFPDAIDILHSTPKEYERLRLFTMESSQATLLYLVVGLLTFFFTKNLLLKVLVLILFFCIQVLINSKGFWISLILTTIIILLSWNIFKRIQFLYFFILIGLLLYFLNFAFQDLLMDIKMFTSFATRLSSLVSAFFILLYYPLGTGYGTFLVFYPEILQKSFGIVDDIFPRFLNITLSDLETYYMISTGQYLTAKGALAQFVMLNGWFGLLFFFSLLYKTLYYINRLELPSRGKINLYFLIILLFVQLTIGSDFTLQYVMWLPIALVEYLYIRSKMEKRKNV